MLGKSSSTNKNGYEREFARFGQVVEKLTQAEKFNPDVNVREVSRLRRGYVDLLATLNSNRMELVLPESEALTGFVCDADEKFEKVSRTVDATLDSKFLAASAEIGAEKVSKLALGALPFSVKEFSALIRSAVTPQSASRPNQSACSWTLEDPGVLASAWRGTCAPDFMLGPISIPLKRKEEALRSKRARAAPESVPLTRPKQNDPRFVIDPNSFSKTVENIFYASFLLNDSKASAYLDPDGELMISAGRASDEVEDGDDRRRRLQIIMGMSMARWRALVKHYNISKSTL